MWAFVPNLTTLTFCIFKNRMDSPGHFKFRRFSKIDLTLVHHTKKRSCSLNFLDWGKNKMLPQVTVEHFSERQSVLQTTNHLSPGPPLPQVIGLGAHY